MMEFALERFVAAQEGVYGRALAELRLGRKASHWMWFVFPQLAGLGRSEAARFYAIGSVDEARAYLSHPLLGARLRECTKAMLAHRGLDVATILGAIDAMKFRSSMTLFEAIAEAPELFPDALDAFYDGTRDPATLELLAA
jgi:uncharacterized protein (DUF1810 family)